MSENNNSNSSASETWNLPISKEEWEEIMEFESIMELEETMRLVFEEEREREEEMKKRRVYMGHYADDRDYFRDYGEEVDYRY